MSNGKKLRVGLIGLGGVSIPHLEGYKSVPQIEVVAGSEVREDRLKEMASRYGFKPYINYEEMLKKEKPDIACILTPVSTHRAVTEKVAEQGIHVFCEKPIANTLEDAQAMTETCSRHNVKLFYGASYRYLPALMKAKEIIREGIIGNVYLMMELLLGGKGVNHYSEMQHIHYPKGGPGGSGMGLVDHGIHLIDTFSWLMDSNVDSVYGRGNFSGDKPDTEYLLMNFKNGATGHLIYNDITFSSDMPTEGLFSWGSGWNVAGKYMPSHTWHDQPGNIRVHGTKGALRIYHYANQLFLTTEKGQEQIRLQDRPTPGNFALEMEAFVNNILKKEEPAVTGEDGIKALKVLLASYESFKKQQVIKI